MNASGLSKVNLLAMNETKRPPGAELHDDRKVFFGYDYDEFTSCCSCFAIKYWRPALSWSLKAIDPSRYQLSLHQRDLHSPPRRLFQINRSYRATSPRILPKTSHDTLLSTNKCPPQSIHLGVPQATPIKDWLQRRNQRRGQVTMTGEDQSH